MAVGCIRVSICLFSLAPCCVLGVRVDGLLDDIRSSSICLLSLALRDVPCVRVSLFGHLGLGIYLRLGVLDGFAGGVLSDRFGLVSQDQIVLDAPTALGDAGTRLRRAPTNVEI